MKIGSQHRTRAIGNDAEYYFGALTGLYNNPNGKFRPDFVTSEKNFEPKLSVELKSGRNRKGVLCDYQLRYSRTSSEDYQDLFGENLGEKDIAYYYSLLSRRDDIPATELGVPFSTIRLTWGDQHMIPGEMGLYIFAIRKAMRKVYQSQKAAKKARSQKKRIPEILYPESIFPQTLRGLEPIIEREADEDGFRWSSHQKRDPQSWQSLEGRDLDAIYKEDESLTSKSGLKRIELLKRYYPGFDSLRRVEIPSTEDSKIYVLCEESHEELFDRQLRKVVEERLPRMNELTQERRDAESLLEKIELIKTVKINGFDLFNQNEGHEEIEEDYSLEALSTQEIRKLRRLSFWASREESLPGYFNDGLEASDSFVDEENLETRGVEEENSEEIPF